MRRVLIIDDDAGIIEVLTAAIGAGLANVEVLSVTEFGQAPARVAELRPDAVVLDLLQGPVTPDPPGQATWKSIWSGRFCPVVVYTAGSGELDPPVPPDHPFLKIVKKGSGTEGEVVALLQGFRPLVEALAKLHAELDSVVQRVLRDTAGAAVLPGTDAAHLVHAARRRVAAMMDEASATENRPLFSWEQYLVPAIGTSPLTGDLLRRHGSNWDDPTGYRLVLSPSCDLVVGRNESTVLVAKCGDAAALLKAVGLAGTADVDKVKSRALSPGFANGCYPLPEFPNHIPLLVARLKDLEVVPYEQIGPDSAGGATYKRIASIDSPFREQVAWAFLNTVARPGMPDRELTAWATALVAAGRAAPEPNDGTVKR